MMGRLLALDVGDRRLGVAVCDPLRIVARPLCIIDRQREDAASRIAALVREYEVDAVLIGYPYHADGRESAQAERVRAFAESLRARVSVPLHFVDERYTSQEAQLILRERRRRRELEHDDAIAAAVLLQRALDEGISLT